jgi:hypothetical protein
MIDQKSPAIEIKIALKNGKSIFLDTKRDKFTILDNGVLLVEHGVHGVTYLAPDAWFDVQVIDQIAAHENLLRRYGKNKKNNNETDDQ